MINLAKLGRVFFVCGKADMRRGIDSLAYIVKKSFNLDSFFECVFLFCGSRRDRFNANFPGFYNSSHTADRFSASRISFMHDFPEMRGFQL